MTKKERRKMNRANKAFEYRFFINDEPNMHWYFDSAEERERFIWFANCTMIKFLVLDQAWEGHRKLNDFLKMVPWMDWKSELNDDVVREKFEIDDDLWKKMVEFTTRFANHPALVEWKHLFSAENFCGKEG